jgi:hypothetical protein
LLSGHAFEQEVQQQLLQQNGANFFLRKLHQMRPALVRKSLLVSFFSVVVGIFCKLVGIFGVLNNFCSVYVISGEF